MNRHALLDELEKELSFSFARSGGSGGQHVNKVETKVILDWDFRSSGLLTDEEKDRIHDRLSRFVKADGTFQLYHQTERSQIRNREIAVDRWRSLVDFALTKQKKRRRTKPSKSSIQRHRKKMEQRKQIKKWRKKPRLD